MKTVTQYREDLSRLVKKVGDIDAKCIAENRDPNEHDISEKDRLMNDCDDLRSIIAVADRQEKLTAALSAPVSDPLSRPKPSNVKVGDDNRSKDTFRSFGEQLMAIKQASRPGGGGVDPRLYNAATGLGESVPSDGGFLVQQDFSSEILADVMKTGQLYDKVRKVQISGNANSIKINGIDETSRATTRSGGILGYWLDEAADKQGSRPKFRKIELSLNKLCGLCYATDELLDDASALEGIIRSGFAGEFGFRLDDAIFNGTGAGQPLGILNAGCLVSVAKETGQAPDTVVTENIVNMYSRMFASSRPNAVWLINQNIEPQLYTMSLGVGTGGSAVYMPPGGLSGSPYGTLLGRPVIAIEQAATLGDAGDIVFADLGGGYIMAEKGGMKSDMSIHVAFVSDQSVFRFVMRVDGQPIRASALTPYKGGATSTLSHFVALAAR